MLWESVFLESFGSFIESSSETVEYLFGRENIMTGGSATSACIVRKRAEASREEGSRSIWNVPEATSPGQLQLVQPHMVSFRASATPRPSSYINTIYRRYTIHRGRMKEASWLMLQAQEIYKLSRMQRTCEAAAHQQQSPM